MKYIRTYESTIKPQIGDYAIVEPNANRFWDARDKHWRGYLNCHIGKIVAKYYYTYLKYLILKQTKL